MKVKVIIEEVVSKVFEVEVGAIEDALQMAQAKYCAGELVLDPGEALSRRIAMQQNPKEELEWVDF